MAAWVFLLIGLASLGLPFALAARVDRGHPAFTSLGLGLGLGFSLAFGVWRTLDGISRFSSPNNTPRGLSTQVIFATSGLISAVIAAALSLMVGVMLGGILSRRFGGSISE